MVIFKPVKSITLCFLQFHFQFISYFHELLLLKVVSNNGIRWPNNGGRYMLISNNREELQTYAATLINQLSNGEYRTPRQHQQMIDTARYCLQQLKLHARLTQHYRLQNNNSYYGRNNFNYNNYSTFSSQRRYGGRGNDSIIFNSY